MTGDVAPIGFATTSQSSDNKQMLIVAEVVFDKNTPALPAPVADAILFSTDKLSDNVDDLGKLARKFDLGIWGVRCESLSRDDLTSLVETDCDFVVLSPTCSSSTLCYHEEKPGILICVDASTDAKLLGTVNMFDIDAIVIDRDLAQPSDINIEDAMKFGLISSIIDQPIIIRLSDNISTDTLEQLRDIGINGVVLPWKTAEDDASIDRMRKCIAELSADRGKKKNDVKRGARSARLPNITVEPGQLDEYE